MSVSFNTSISLCHLKEIKIFKVFVKICLYSETCKIVYSWNFMIILSRSVPLPKSFFKCCSGLISNLEDFQKHIYNGKLFVINYSVIRYNYWFTLQRVKVKKGSKCYWKKLRIKSFAPNPSFVRIFRLKK